MLSRKTALQIPELVCVARHGEIVELSAETTGYVADMRELLEKQLQDGRTYYGINSGFGSLASCSLPQEQAQQLSRNLITSHSVGAGPKFEEEVVRAAMLIRIKSLSAGHSGVRPAVLELYRNALNRSIFPSVPSQGSLGACGDLAPLSHLALALTKGASAEDTDEGRIWLRLRNDPAADDVSTHEIMVTHDYETNEQKVWKSVPASKVLGDQRLVLESKEGLALNNGATFSAALAALLVNDAERLLNDATAVMAIALEAVEGVRDSFLSPVVAVRPHPGSLRFSETMTAMLAESKAVSGSLTENPARIPPQEPYSIRCATSAFGGFWATHRFLREAVEIEINSVTDNPLFFGNGTHGVQRDYCVLSGGNFHGDPIAIPLDSMSLALTKLGSLLERLVFKLTDWSARGLPPYLIGSTQLGLNSGFMILQYTAASLVNECQTLCHPASANSIPSSANQEDYVSMSMNAAKNCRSICTNAEVIVAIAAMTACQAIDVSANKPLERMSPRTRAIYDLVRSHVQMVKEDRVMEPDFKAILQLMRSGQIAKLVV